MVDSHQQGAARVRQQLAAMGQASRQRGQGGLNSGHRALSAWQVQRLSRTHQDFLHHQRFRPAMRFFLQELYGPKDFSQRDQDLQRAAPILIRSLPRELLNTLAMALELHALSFALDDAMVQALGSETLTEESYTRSYRQLANRPQREHQLWLIRELGASLDQAVRMPLVHTALKLARRPARVAGFGELQGFLERGFTAFKHAGGSALFLDTIMAREHQIMQQLFAGVAEPFRLVRDDPER